MSVAYPHQIYSMYDFQFMLWYTQRWLWFIENEVSDVQKEKVP
jgi:hypothetical protein